ncbi:MAG: methionyl-tRNA formyltransferase [Thermodesulfobacteriota bacterium]
MRIVFIGQAPFGAESLQSLIDQGENIVGVITIPDKPNQKYPNPVTVCAQKHSIPLYQTKLLKSQEAISWVKGQQPDLLVLAFVTSFVPLEMIKIAKKGGINYHPSLLPKYRGGSAINWALIHGEKETGVSIHFIDEGVDTGPILLQEKVDITEDDTVKSVYFEKLYPLGIKLIARAVKLIREGKAEPIIQDEAQASFQPVITANDTVIDWSQPTQKVHDLIRGANPAPGAATLVNGAPCKIFDARKGTEPGKPGAVVSLSDDSFSIATGDGSIRVLVIQPAGSKKLGAAEFAKENGLTTGDTFGS